MGSLLSKRLDFLKKENEVLRKENEVLRRDYNKIIEDASVGKKIEYTLEKLRTEKLNAYVDNLLMNNQVNATYIPDFVEKQIYLNVISLIEHLVENTEFKLFGSTIKVKVE